MSSTYKVVEKGCSLCNALVLVNLYFLFQSGNQILKYMYIFKKFQAFFMIT